jgi:hypothetical protein
MNHLKCGPEKNIIPATIDPITTQDKLTVFLLEVTPRIDNIKKRSKKRG